VAYIDRHSVLLPYGTNYHNKMFMLQTPGRGLQITSGLYYKHIMILKDASRSIIMTLEAAFVTIDSSFVIVIMFIAQATAFMICIAGILKGEVSLYH
jgi:hypothetical protein